jgi:hypothetical protein
MKESLWDEIHRLAASLTEADLKPITHVPDLADGDVIVGRMDVQHRRLWTVIQRYVQEMQTAIESAREAAKAADMKRAQALVNRANFLTRKQKTLGDLFYISIRQAFGLEDETSVFIASDWRVGYEGPEKLAARQPALVQTVEKAKAAVSGAITTKAKIAAALAASRKPGDGLKN